MDIELIKEKLLESKDLKAWQLIELFEKRRESYLIRNTSESDRTVDLEKWIGWVFVEHPDGKQGDARFTVLLGDTPDVVSKKIEEAISQAKLVKNEAFELPEGGVDYPACEIADPEIVEKSDEAVTHFKAGILKEVEGIPGVDLSAAELFLIYRRKRIVNSRGLDVSSNETSTLLETVLMSQEKGPTGDEVEFFDFTHSRFVRDLGYERTLPENAKALLDSIRASLPINGEADVVFTDGALDNLFDWFLEQSSGVSHYKGYSQFKVGSPVIQNPKGDLLTLTNNGLIPGMMGTQKFDSFGMPPKKTRVIEKNLFKTVVADKRYADYLEIEPSGDWTNLEVEPGSRMDSEILTRGDRPLYVLSRFSTFNPNGISGAFSAEIRTGYEVLKDGSRRPIKGGSISGTCQKAFQECYLSSETTKRERYTGPRLVRLNGIQTAGE